MSQKFSINSINDFQPHLSGCSLLKVWNFYEKFIKNITYKCYFCLFNNKGYDVYNTYKDIRFRENVCNEIMYPWNVSIPTFIRQPDFSNLEILIKQPPLFIKPISRFRNL